MYYLIQWVDWKNKEMEIRVDPKDVVKMVAVLISSIKPGTIVIKLTD